MKFIKHTLIFFLLALCALTLNAQHAPAGINYQAVLRDQAGQIIADKSIKVKISVIDPETHSSFYTETHVAATNNVGIFSLVIGEGKPTVGTFKEIPWSTANTWLEVAYDTDNNGIYEITGTTRMLSVPYAFYAEKAGSAANSSDPSPFGPDGDGGDDGGDPVDNNSWQLKGNDDVDDKGMWLGTRNMADLIIKTNNVERIIVNKGIGAEPHDGYVHFLEDVIMDGTLHVIEDVTIDATLTVAKDTRINGTLSVTEDVNFGINVDVDHDLHVGNDADIDRNLNVDNSVHIGGNTDIDNSLNVDVNVTVGNNVTVNNNMTVNHSVDIGDDLHVRRDADIDRNLNVDNNTHIGGTLGVNGVAKFDNTTQSFTKDDGAVVIEGGVGIEKNVNIGGNSSVTGNSTIGGTLGVNGVAAFNSLTQSTNKDDGAVVVEGGVGIEKNLNVGGYIKVLATLNVNGTSAFNNDTQSTNKDNGAIVIEGGVGIEKNVNIGGNGKVDGTLGVDGTGMFYKTTQSTNKDNGAVVIEGGVGIEKNLNVGGDAKVTGTMTIDGVTNYTSTAQSTNKDNGAVVLEGGLGIEKNVNMGGNLDILGAANVAGITTISNTSQTFGNNSGALVVSGGVGIGKNATIGGFLGVEGSSQITGVLTVKDQMFAKKRIVITGDADSYGDQLFKSSYPLQVNTGTQGIYIEMETPSAEVNNFITFADLHGVKGRIEGQTLSELQNSFSYIWSNAMSAAETALKGAMIIACTAQADAFEVGVLIIEGTVVASKWAEYNTNLVNNVGVSYQSGAGDYAEWLERSNPMEDYQYGEIVGVRGGKINRNTEGADHFMVVSMAPIVLGNVPAAGREVDYEKVAFMGQVPIRVMGKVAVGDYILPSGHNDGFGIAVNPAKMRIEDYTRIVGVAWQAGESSMMNVINLAVGLNTNDVAARMIQQQRELDVMKGQMNQVFALLGQKSPYEGLGNTLVASSTPIAGAKASSPASTATNSTVDVNQTLEKSRATIEKIFADNLAYLQTQGVDVNKFPEVAAIYNNPVQWMKDQNTKGYLNETLQKVKAEMKP